LGALALIAVFALWFDARRVQQALRTDVAQRLAGVEASLQASQKSQAQLATDLRDAQAKVTLLETRIAESQAQQAALEALYRDLAPSRDEIALSELEQVLLSPTSSFSSRAACRPRSPRCSLPTSSCSGSIAPSSSRCAGRFRATSIG
jgi:hypothetical protein